MQVATLSYHYSPKENFHSDSKSKFQHRHILTTIKNPQKKSKQQQSFLSNPSTNSNAPLPPIKTTSKRPSSIRIKGSGLQSSKFNDVSIASFQQSVRSRSRQSDKSEAPGTRSRSITPSGADRTASKLVRLKFGYPVKIRSSDFYSSDLTASELRFREESFVNDSIRTSTQSTRTSKYPHYEAFKDPNLKEFFQSPLVLDVVRKTLNIDLNERPSDTTKRSKRHDQDNPYHRIVAKHSSGYGKLNGYDCIPSFAQTRYQRSRTHERFQSSANSSLTSFPTYNSISNEHKRKSRSNSKSKQLQPIATSSPVRHQTAATNDTGVASSVSQD